MGYYPYWVSLTFPPEKIDFTKYDWVDFAFVTLNQTYQLSFEDSTCPDLLRRTVAAAHAKGKYVKASIGGWGGSQYFSSAVSTDSNRRVFVQEVIRMIQMYGLDGVDFDWEYPGHEGLAGNQVNPADSSNYLLFLQLLRANLPRQMKITAATSQTPFTDNNGQPMRDVSAFALVLDWIMIMNYDVWQSSSTPGANAPLFDGCHNSTQPEASAASAVKQWGQAGFPLKKQVLGVPYYGYLSNSNATRLRTRASSPTALLVADGGAAQGSISFRNLVNQGALVASSTSDGRRRAFTASSGFSRYWDQCSATPFLRSQASRQLVSYDDPESLRMKGQFAKKMGLLGTNTWEMSGDTAQNDLVVALMDGLFNS
ncbi:glycoside hydrolase family 18 protein [Lentinula aciculospora]|uniref:Glycoside hydrolase family 18 protein n=1 Tax=Lentinula aciculospora TaxID=153920 RepID=A0A9W9AAK4_9AGAR|nr:glycoside hydrolase family 18 protein [Lentinula aciculospora]